MRLKGGAATADRLQQVSAIYHAALARDTGDRDAFLREACAGDDALRREVESLLGYEGAAAPLMETPAADVAAHMLENLESVGSLVGRQIARVTEPLSVTPSGILFVAVTTNAWMNELSLMEPDLLRRLNQRTGRLSIKKIRWQIKRS